MRSGGPPLVRPSQLARFWGLHPRTVQTWIHQGRLAAIRSPGNHFRVRVADVRAFCEKESLAVPPFVVPPPKRVILAAPDASLRRAVARALRSDATLETFEDPYDAVVAAASAPTHAMAVNGAARHFDARAAIRALKRAASTASIALVAFGARSRAAATVLERAGADRSMTRLEGADLPRVLCELLGMAAET
ncbi:MAG TPA: helix-turn-helix domain-containing protein [Polyangiaceae bacterium]|nr:helix-turn-helix domain-containing protein [Polyangiaceae bacterium]